jgi:hypothetical protein
MKINQPGVGQAAADTRYRRLDPAHERLHFVPAQD